MEIKKYLTDKSFSRSCSVPVVNVPNAQQYAMYSILLKLTPTSSSQDEIEVNACKRFSDVKKLFQVLHTYHTRLHRPQVMPQLVKAGYFDRFDPKTLDERKASVESVLQFCCQLPHLFCHGAFVAFFESGTLTVRRDTMETARDSLLDLLTVLPTPATVEAAAEQLDEPLRPLSVILLPTVAPSSTTLTPSPISPTTTSITSIQPGWPSSSSAAAVTPLDSGISATMTTTTTTLHAKGKVIDYLHVASEHTKMADVLEIAEDYAGAFHALKLAVGVLLEGVKKESDPQIQKLAKQLALECLQKAETFQQQNILVASSGDDGAEAQKSGGSMEDNFLETTSDDNNNGDNGDGFMMLEMKPIQMPSTNRFTEMRMLESDNLETWADPVVSVLRTVSELSDYSIIGVIDTVLLVVHRAQPETYVVKSYRKPAHLTQPSVKTVLPLPREVPYHCPLVHTVDSADAVYCILHYIDPGVAGCSTLQAWVEKYFSVNLQFCQPPFKNSSSVQENLVRARRSSSIYAGRYLDAPPSLDHSTTPVEVTAVEGTMLDDLTSSEICVLSETHICRWAAELVLCVGKLHQLGLRLGYLDANDILLSPGGHLTLTYRCQLASSPPSWYENGRLHPHQYFPQSGLFVAPEQHEIKLLAADAKLISEHVRRCDWYSVGLVLYPLFSGGYPLHYVYPHGLCSHTKLCVAPTSAHTKSLSKPAVHFISQLLNFDPIDRLGCGSLDSEEIMMHPFFENIDWHQVLTEGLHP